MKWTMLPTYIAKLTFEDSWKWGVGLIGTAFQYVLPESGMREMAAGAFAFVVLDTLTGIVGAAVSGKAITSAGVARFFVKIFGYSCCILVCSLTARYVLPGVGDAKTWLINLILWVVLLTEGVSILENVQKMGLKLPKWIAGLLRERLNDLGSTATTRKEEQL